MLIDIIETCARRMVPAGRSAFQGVVMDRIVMGLDLDAVPLKRHLSNLEQAQLPFAASRALNDTAYDVLDHIKERMRVVFDRPTRWTLNALMVKPARKNDLEAVVKERPSVSARHYLKVQEGGGPRGQTGVEKLLSSKLAYSGLIQAVLPAENARLDGFGNWSSGERNQVLAALAAQRDATANTSDASRKRSKGRATYFVPKGGLAPGVYKRASPGADPQRVLKFTAKTPTYRPLLGFYDGAAEIWAARLPDHLAKRLEQAVAAAR